MHHDHRLEFWKSSDHCQESFELVKEVRVQLNGVKIQVVLKDRDHFVYRIIHTGPGHAAARPTAFVGETDKIMSSLDVCVVVDVVVVVVVVVGRTRFYGSRA